MIIPIVLAAGESRRMGRPKALLRDADGRTFVARIVRTFADAGFGEVVIVTGALHAGIIAALSAEAPAGITVHVARNPDVSRGQLSSLLVGLSHAARPGVDAVMMTLVDVPFVSAGTVRAVADAYLRSRASIVRPAQGNRHGHPVIFDRRTFDELRRADPATGAKAVLRARAAEIVHVPIADEGAYVDVDTPEEYAAALASDDDAASRPPAK